MSLPKVTEDEIRHTFYNLMLDLAITQNYNLEVPNNLKLILTQSIKTICQEYSKHGYPTINGRWVTPNNVEPDFKPLFQALDYYRTYKQVDTLNQLILDIELRPMYRQISQDLIRFYKDAIREVRKSEVNEDTIRETFYNLMVEDLLVHQRIQKSSLKDQDPFIYLDMSSFAILSCLVSAQNLSPGYIPLQNGARVTMENCPKSYQLMFQYLIKAQTQFQKLKPTASQLEFIYLACRTDPESNLPDFPKTPEIMHMVALISGLSIQISSMDNFKSIMEDVIKFCLDADQPESDQWVTLQ